MSVETVKYVRKPFEVDAVQVTADNMQEVAAWCKGEIIVEGGSQGVPLRQYIKVDVDRVLNDRQTMAFVNDWILFANNTFKVYTNKAFGRTFDKIKPVEPATVG